MIKADYSELATTYDKGTTLSDYSMELWLNLICKYASYSNAPRVLDLGCGTGRFSLPMADRLGFDVTGVDASGDMLEKAKQKDSKSAVNWIQNDADSLIFADGTFDIVFMSHLIHHLDNPEKTLAECSRVINQTGLIMVRYGALDQIENDVVHTFFPQVNEIDKERTPTRDLIEQWLFDAGFVDVVSEEVIQKTYDKAEARLEAIKVKNISVLSLISNTSFNTGISRLSEYINKNPNEQWLLFDRLTLTTGYKLKQPA